MNHRDLRKIKNRNHQILSARKGIRKRLHANVKRKYRNDIDFNKEDLSIPFEHYEAKSIVIGDPSKGRKIHLQLLLEYSALFPQRKLDIKKEICNFSRNTLLRMVLVLGRNYGMCRISDMGEKPFFSFRSGLSKIRIRCINEYLRRNRYAPSEVSYASSKTFLEFLRLIFSVKSEFCQDKYEPFIAEVKAFDLLLAINEQKVTKCQPSKKDNNLARMLYAGLYAPSEFSNRNETLDLSEQIYYALTFFEFISSRVEYQDIYKKFLDEFSISKWEEYFLTILWLNMIAYTQGLNFLDLDSNDPDHILNKNVLLKVSIKEDAYFDDEKTNRDIIVFRSKPIIEMNDGRYLLYNKQLMINRLYNSIYFDLLPCGLTYKDKSFNQFYKEVFVEKYLFDHSILGCLKDRNLQMCFPRPEDIEKDGFVDIKEEENQPDFYFRESNDVFIFECKAIKLNGDLKANANVDDILDELENKLSIKRWSLHNGEKRVTKEKPEGVGQLVNHIVRLENGEFKWDKTSPATISSYYPVLVLESSEIAQIPLLCIANEWYQKQMDLKTNICKKKCKPLIVMTIKTLFLYDHLFKENGLKYYFDRFISSHIHWNDDSSYSMSESNDFDTWMRVNHDSNKSTYYKLKFDEIIKRRREHEPQSLLE